MMWNDFSLTVTRYFKLRFEERIETALYERR